MAKLTAEQRIEKVHVSLMRNQKFCLFSGLFMVGKVEVRDDVPTAATDGVNVLYGRDFIESLDDKQIGFLVLHEAMHKAYRHLTTWEKLYKDNKSLANIACDHVINLQIIDYDPDELYVAMPRDAEGKVMGCADERFRGMDAGQVFAILKKELPPPPPHGDGGDGGGDNPTQGRNVQGSEGFDEHLWEQANEMEAKEVEEIGKEIDNALRQGALLAGKMNGNLSREIQDLLTPKVDWREVLREFVKQVSMGKDDSSWRRYNKRLMGAGIYMPTSISQRIGCIVDGIDTSGSIDGEILTQFLSETKAICEEVKPQTVELLYWDSRVASRETYEDSEVENLINSTKPRGGGGTDPRCVLEFIKKNDIKPDCVVMLTDGHFFDGEGDWESIDAPVLWCVIDNKQFIPKYGKVVHI